MNPVPVGTRIRVVGKSNDHSYDVGQVYTVALVDSDGTFRARDAAGKTGNWLRWTDCEPVTQIGWKYIQEVLPPEVIEFLEAFDGVDNLVLRDEVKDEILAKLPSLQDEILAASRKIREEGGFQSPGTDGAASGAGDSEPDDPFGEDPIFG